MNQQLFCPVLKIENDELWTPSIMAAYPLPAYTFESPETNVVYKNILGEPAIVSWIGEYSHIENIAKHFESKLIFLKEFSVKIECLDLDDSFATFNISEKENALINSIKRTSFLINVDTSEFVDLSKYSLSQGIDPLPFLTAAAIHKGGEGDNFLGRWAFAHIKMTRHRPEGKELAVIHGMREVDFLP